MAPASFEGLRVLSLESRRANEMVKLIRTYGGEPFVVPAPQAMPPTPLPPVPLPEAVAPSP